jgi:transposase-like protein
LKTAYSPEVKAQVVAALLAGQGVTEVAATYKLPENTVKTWKRRLKDPEGGTKVSEVEPAKKEQIGDLLIDYLHANLQTLRKQNEVFSDPVWLAKQNAADVAVLHGVITDKTIRLLDALGSNASGS